MQRACDVCGEMYEAKRATSKVCSSGCRVRKSRAAPAEDVPKSLDDLTVRRGSALTAAITRELSAAGRLETSLGQQAIMLANRIGAPMDTGASVASMSKELREVMVRALEGSRVAADPMDELKARRERSNAG